MYQKSQCCENHFSSNWSEAFPVKIPSDFLPPWGGVGKSFHKCRRIFRDLKEQKQIWEKDKVGGLTLHVRTSYKAAVIKATG